MKLFKGVFTSGQSGVTLVEAVVTMAIIGTIAVAFLTGLATTSKARFLADEQSTAESLAQSQMEWVQSADYAANYTPGPISTGKDYTNYSVIIEAVPLHDPDEGIQRITISVQYQGEPVAKLEGYKVDR